MLFVSALFFLPLHYLQPWLSPPHLRPGFLPSPDSLLAEGERKEHFPDVIVEPLEILPSDRIPNGTFVRSERDFILCRGERFQGKPPAGKGTRIRWEKKVFDNAGLWNNDVIDELGRIGSYEPERLELALRKFMAGLQDDPLFFPFLYNTGRIYLLMNRPRLAVRYLEKAGAEVPPFFGVNMNLGFAYARMNEEQNAVRNFRLAAKKNPFDLRPFIALGNFYLESGSPVKAGYYFRQVLKRNPEHSNALLGIARLYMKRKDYVRARILMKNIPTENLDGTPRRDYDRSLHYYLALLATELRDYQDAVSEFDRLLSFQDDPFFLKRSVREISRRREIVRRLLETKKSKLKED